MPPADAMQPNSRLKISEHLVTRAVLPQLRLMEPLGMPCYMFGHEGRNEVVGMIVTRLHADRCRLSGLGAGIDQHLSLELVDQKSVSHTLIDQQVWQASTIGDERTGIIFAPHGPVRPDISRQ